MAHLDTGVSFVTGARRDDFFVKHSVGLRICRDVEPGIRQTRSPDELAPALARVSDDAKAASSLAAVMAIFSETL
jgi:hypothetical protein